MGKHTFQLTVPNTARKEFCTFSRQSTAPPEVGAEITGVLDWERRYQVMRTHTAMHILCGTIFRDYGAQVTGGDMEPLKGRMDFEFESMTKDLVEVIEQAVNKEVDESPRCARPDPAARGSIQDPRPDPHQDQPAAQKV